MPTGAIETAYRRFWLLFCYIAKFECVPDYQRRDNHHSIDRQEHSLIGNAGRLPWRMPRETLRRQVPAAM